MFRRIISVYLIFSFFILSVSVTPAGAFTLGGDVEESSRLAFSPEAEPFKLDMPSFVIKDDRAYAYDAGSTHGSGGDNTQVAFLWGIDDKISGFFKRKKRGVKETIKKKKSILKKKKKKALEKAFEKQRKVEGAIEKRGKRVGKAIEPGKRRVEKAIEKKAVGIRNLWPWGKKELAPVQGDYGFEIDQVERRSMAISGRRWPTTGEWIVIILAVGVGFWAIGGEMMGSEAASTGFGVL